MAISLLPMPKELIFLLLFGGVMVYLVTWAITTRRKRKFLREHGEKVTGLVIDFKEASNRRDQIGGNIYMPTVRFTTCQGKEIVGTPVSGFVAQTEIGAGYNVYVYYNPAKPSEFYVDLH